MENQKAIVNQAANVDQKYPLASSPEDIVASLLVHFNSMDVDIMLDFYEEGAILINAAGEPQRGKEQIRAELLKYYSVQLPMHINTRHIFVCGDTASLVLDWNIAGTAPDGSHVHMVATSNDIARKGSDGLWRYIIDNPFGTQVRRLY
jgi:ketosteroid isomerase-like protein